MIQMKSSGKQVFLTLGAYYPLYDNKPRCDPDFAGRTLASGAGPLHRESTFRATPADKAREQALLDRRAARDRMAMRLYTGLACLTLAGLVVSILWYFGIIQRWYATYTG